jgi:3-isopropylmalate dehydrogenase
MPTPDIAIAMGIFTRHAIERVARVGFDLAMRRRKRLTVVHKANVLRMTMGLFLETCRDVGRAYADVALDDVLIDAMAGMLVRDASEFDVIVVENMFGDILSNLAAEIAGSVGVAASLNVSDTAAMAQASHGSAPDIAGKGIANPVAMILSGAMLLDWLGSRNNDVGAIQAASRVRESVSMTLSRGTRTPDLGGTASTSEVVKRICRYIADQ